MVALALCQRLADRVETWNEIAVGSDCIKHFLSYTGHDYHVANNVFRVCDLDSVLGDRRTHRTHAVRDYIHSSSLHTSGIELGHGLLKFHWIDPMVGRACIFLFP